MLVEIGCTCGGTTSVPVEEGQTTAVTECACGKVLFWSEGGKVEVKDPEPKVLSIAVDDSAKAHDKFGS